MRSLQRFQPAHRALSTPFGSFQRPKFADPAAESPRRGVGLSISSATALLLQAAHRRGSGRPRSPDRGCCERLNAHLVETPYDKGIKISNAQMKALPMSRHEDLPRWNYTLQQA